MTQLFNFGRRYRLTIGEPNVNNGSVIISTAHIEASISEVNKSDVNQLDLKIFNQSKETIALFEKSDVVVTLEVAYEDTPWVTLFSGNKTYVSTKREPTEVITRVLVAEGVVAIRDGDVRITLEEGVTLKKVITEIFNKGGLGSPSFPIDDPILKKTFPLGYSASGVSKTILDNLCGVYNLKWKAGGIVWPANRENNTIAVLVTPDKIKNSPEITNKEVAELKDDLGLPEKTGVNFTTPLNPLLKVGGLVKLQGTFNADGVYLMTKVSHELSYEGDVWDTIVECSVSEFV